MTMDHHSPPDYYRVLQVPPHADGATLRQAFLRLCKHHHPDTTSLPKAVASERFLMIKAAYATLQDPAARHRHDTLLQQHSAAGTGPVAAPGPQEKVLQEQWVSPYRPLSGGEWLALMLLVGALLFCGVLISLVALQHP